MKNHLLFLLMVILLASCKNENMGIIEEGYDHNVTLEALLKLNEAEQRVVVSGLESRQQIVDLFKSKLDVVLNQKRFFPSEKEQELIKALRRFLDSDIVANYPATINQFNQFLDNWYFKSVEDVGWEPLVYRFLVYSLETDYTNFLNEYDREDDHMPPKMCECSMSGQGAFYPDCTLTNIDCVQDPTCTPTTSGCGAFWMSSCDGECDRLAPPEGG